MYEYIVYTVQSPPKLFTLLAPKKKDGDRTHRSKGKGRRVCLGEVFIQFLATLAICLGRFGRIG